MTPSQYILAAAMFDDTTRFKLLSANPAWFDSHIQQAIQKIQELYLANKPLNNSNILIELKGTMPMRDLVMIQGMATDYVLVDAYLKQLAKKHEHERLVQGLSQIDLKGDIVSQLTTLISTATIHIDREPISSRKAINKACDDICEAFKRQDATNGMKTGWRYLDKYLGGWNRGDLIICAGRPGMGKSAIAMTWALEASKWYKVLFLSLEMSVDQLARRILTHETHIENYKIRSNSLSQGHIDRIVDYTIADNPVLWLDDDTSLRIDRLSAKLKIHQQKHGLDLLVIDYIQLMKGTKQNRQEEVAEISRNLKLIAKDLGICVIALSQLSRAVEQRSDHRPLLSDLRESGAIEQDADAILFPYRPCYYQDEKPDTEEAELMIAKNRHGECVTIDVKFTGSLTKFTE